MYSLEDLQKMSKEQLILLVITNQKKIEEVPQRKSKAGVVNVGSPKIVTDYVNAMKRKLEAQRGGN